LLDIQDLIREKISELCQQGSRIIEVGSGDGRVISLLKKRKPALVIGTDMLDFSYHHKKLSTPFIRCYISHLPFKDRIFTTAIASNVFPAITRLVTNQTLSELHRVTSKGGTILFSTYNSKAPVFRIKMIIRWKIFFFTLLPLGYQPKKLAAKLSSYRLKIDKVIPFYIHPDNIIRKGLLSKIIRPFSLMYYKMSLKRPLWALMYIFKCIKT